MKDCIVLMVRNIIIVSSNCQPKYVLKITTHLSDSSVLPGYKLYGIFTVSQSLFFNIILLNCETEDGVDNRHEYICQKWSRY